MARRNGVPSMLKHADQLCRLLNKYEKIILIQFPGNNELTAALLAARLACAILQNELEDIRVYGD